MAARAMWKADLALGETKVPVKLYSAAQDTTVHFRLLHATDNAPVKQQLVDPETEQPVAPAETKKAVMVDRGVYVVLSAEEQAALTPKPSRLISVEQVVTSSAVDERWFDRPYYLGPDGDEEAYFALAETLKKRDSVGIVHWVLRSKRYVGALQSSGGYLLLDTLRFAQQIVEVGAVRPNANRTPDKREIALAEQLIGALEDRFDATEFRDEYQEQLRNLLAAKAEDKVVRFPRAPKRERSDSLLASLQASLKTTREEASHGRRG
jgi:DNA end-binding protein Ku